MREISLHNCRICRNEKLVPIGSLGNIAISNFTNKPSEGSKWPLTLVYCTQCTLLQLEANIPRYLLYRNYWYQSHFNKVIVDDLKEIAGLIQGDVHIDIGANDGTLLKYSKAKVKIAVDPSNIEPNGFTWIQKYWENVNTVPAHTITAIACLYDLHDPNRFIENVKNHLSVGGVFISQLMTLQPMIDNNDLGNICHEHIEYYSYKSLVTLFERNGLEIFKVDKNKINGGSYRVFARHYTKGSIEFKEKTYGVKELENFFKRIEKNKNDFLKWVSSYDRVMMQGYGASTKANTILQYYGTNKFTIVDVNPDKIGKFTVGSNSIVVSKINPSTDYLWVFPYGFIDYFKKKEKKYKGKWVTTIPEFKIL